MVKLGGDWHLSTGICLTQPGYSEYIISVPIIPDIAEWCRVVYSIQFLLKFQMIYMTWGRPRYIPLILFPQMWEISYIIAS